MDFCGKFVKRWNSLWEVWQMFETVCGMFVGFLDKNLWDDYRMFEIVCEMFDRFLDKNLWDVCRMFEWSMGMFIECLKEIYGMFAECIKKFIECLWDFQASIFLIFLQRGYTKYSRFMIDIDWWHWRWLKSMTLIALKFSG